jgi:hypothetical protein
MEQTLLKAYLCENITPNEFDMMMACVDASNPKRNPMCDVSYRHMDAAVRYLQHEDSENEDAYKYWNMVYRHISGRSTNVPQELKTTMHEWIEKNS